MLALLVALQTPSPSHIPYRQDPLQQGCPTFPHLIGGLVPLPPLDPQTPSLHVNPALQVDPTQHSSPAPPQTAEELPLCALASFPAPEVVKVEPPQFETMATTTTAAGASRTRARFIEVPF